MCVACSWLGNPCVIERIKANLSDRPASFGRGSQISIPGVRVAIG
jgi:hypothetical protein